MYFMFNILVLWVLFGLIYENESYIIHKIHRQFSAADRLTNYYMLLPCSNVHSYNQCVNEGYGHVYV